MEDEQLLKQARRGDQSAFAELVRRYRPYVYTIAWKITLHEEDALDVTQEVMMRAAQNLDAVRSGGAFRGWLGSIAAREAINHCRRPARREIPTEPAKLAEAIDTSGAKAGHGAVALIETKRNQAAVAEAMVHLSPQQRAILTLMLKEDLQPHEVAAQLSLNDGQVRSQIHRAVQTLRRYLTETDKKEGTT